MAVIEHAIQVVFGTCRHGEKYGGHRHTYAYEIPDEFINENLWLYNRVIVPPNWAHPYSQIATIVAWGRGDYDGPLQEIEGIIHDSKTIKAERFRAIEAGRVQAIEAGRLSPARFSEEGIKVQVDGGPVKALFPGDRLQINTRAAELMDEIRRLERQIGRLENRSASASALIQVRKRIESLERAVRRLMPPGARFEI